MLNRLGPLLRQRLVQVVATVRVGVSLNNQFAARKYIDRFLNLGQQFEVFRLDLRRATVKTQPNQAQNNGITLTEHTRFRLREHLVDPFELFLDARLRFQALHQRSPFRGGTAEACIQCT